MCGILYYRSQKLVRGDERIARAMSHISVRGPDGQDVLWGEGYALGHTRLAIIDPSAAANQPFWDASRRYVIAYNGEIYNYAELRRELINRGINLRTTSDTEVLIELLARDGWAATCRRVRGMFAFILIDNETGKVLVARDHFGQKPLYWHYSGGAFAAAVHGVDVAHTHEVAFVGTTMRKGADVPLAVHRILVVTAIRPTAKDTTIRHCARIRGERRDPAHRVAGEEE